MIRLSVRRPVAVAMAYLAMGVVGIAAWRNIPLELLPDAAHPRLTVQAFWPGASPETTEAFLTAPLEAAIQQVRGIERVVSESSDRDGVGTARIEVEFARETDMDFARLELSERLAALGEALPAAAVSPRISDYVPEELREQTRPFLRYTVTGPFTLEALRRHVDDAIAPDLLRVDGVAAVQPLGGRGRLLEVELSNGRVQALGLSAEHVRRVLQELEFVREAGRIRERGRLYSLALRERVISADEVRRVPLLSNAGRIVRLQDVATVRDTYEELGSYYRIDGQPAVSFEVRREIGTNAVAVADRVKARLAQLEGAHPPGVRLILDDDESKAIRAQLSDLRSRAVLSGVVIFFVLLLFLRSWRGAGLVFATIAFAVLITVNLMYWVGYSLNVLTLMGLAMGLGLIVDSAIVVLENVYRCHRAGGCPAEAAERGAREVLLPVLAATLTTLVVMIPFVYLQGELRVFYVPLALVTGFSLLSALCVAFSLIPSLGSRILVNSDRETETRGRAVFTPTVAGDERIAAHRRWYIRAYSGLTGWTLHWPWATVALAVGLFGGSFYLFDEYVDRGVVWGQWGGNDSYLDIHISLPRGEELARTDQLARFFEHRLASLPQVERFVSQVRPQFAHLRVTFPDSLESTWVPDAVKEQLVAFSHGFGGAEVRVYGYGPSFYGGRSNPPSYSIQVLGYNYKTVLEISEDVATRLVRFSRIRDVDINSTGRRFERDKATELVLSLDRERLAMHGLSPQQVVEQVRSAAQGREGRGSILRIGSEEVRLSVKLAGHERLADHALMNLFLPTPRGSGVRLGDVAALAEHELQARISRQDQQYERTIAYEFRGPAKLGDQVRDAVVAATVLPPGYSIRARQIWNWSNEERQQIYGVLAVSLLLVFMVTAAVFESIRQPMVVLLSVPMGLVGVFLVYFYTGASFTREAYIGVIMMGGIVVNNAILLVNHINLRRRESGLALTEAVQQGTMERVRPILMTSATTILGLLPLVLLSETADQNIWNAFGYALIGGMTSSTVLVLTVTPTLYFLIERRSWES